MVDALFLNLLVGVQGMLLRKSIEFTNMVENSVQPYMLPTETRGNLRTIAIHSRHIRDSDDGSNVSAELKCLDEIMRSTARGDGEQQPPCKVFVMSDRAATLDAIQRESEKRNCSAVVVEHDSAEHTANAAKEHGPFAGAGFFRDWLVAAQAQTGFIHFQDRSSSALVYETMVYDGMTRGTIESPVLRCSIDWRHGSKLSIHDY